MTPRAHRLLHALLACCPLGARRDDVEADLMELFESRREERGPAYATWRLLGDVVSLAMPRRRPPASRAHGRSRPRGAGGWVVDLQNDLRHGLRLLAKHPGLIGATVGGLSLAIAVSTTVFTIVNATVLRSYGMSDPGTVVRVQMLLAHGAATDWPFHAFVDLRDHATRARIEASLSERVRFSTSSADTADRTDPLLVVSGGYLPLLGAHAVLGRTLQPSDDVPGAAPVMVLNHSIWTARLHRDPDVVGKTVWVSGMPVTVVGVLERSFTGPLDTPPAFWTPFGSYGAIFKDRPVDRGSALRVTIVGRFAADADRGAATADLSAIAAAAPDAGIRTASGGMSAATGVRLDGASSPMAGHDEVEMLILVGVIFSVVGLVLALACVNLSNLLLAGAAARAREIAVRVALGASRRRILRQLLTESLLVGGLAGAVGLLLAIWLVPIVGAATALPATYDVHPDGTVLAFAASVAILAGLGAGLAPARHGARGDVTGALKSDGAQTGTPRETTRLRRWFVGFQAAASILLLVTAALFLRGALHLTRVDLGFDADRLATAAVAFPRADKSIDARAYWRLAIERVRALPSVEAAALSLYPPFGDGISVRMMDPEGDYRLYSDRTDAAFFDTAGFRLIRGRAYTAAEVQADAPVAVVSESIVRDLLGGVDPIGASLSAVSASLANVRIIGVVADAMTVRVIGRGNGTIYQPLSASSDMEAAHLVVRAAHPSAIVRALDTALVSVDPRVRPATTVMHDDVDRFMNGPKVLALTSTVVAGLALVLSVLGLFGVTMFVVRQRLREVQVRRAIGASTSDIVGLLVRQSLTPVLVGLAVGLAVALSAARVLTPALSGIDPHDPLAILGAVVLLTTAAVAAVLVPALRASRTDPGAVLRG